MTINVARAYAQSGIEGAQQAAVHDLSPTGKRVVLASPADPRSPVAVVQEEDGGLIDLALFFAILSILAGAYGFTGMMGSGAPAFVFSIALVGVIAALVLRRILFR